MKLVIDIPDDFYERMIEENGMSYIDADVVVNAFYKSTPLDKIRERISLEKLGYPPIFENDISAASPITGDDISEWQKNKIKEALNGNNKTK